MIFTKTKLNGAYIIDLERLEDERGFYARAWCKEEIESYGLVSELAQVNISYAKRLGTLRGLHYQHPPYGEVKLMRCVRGAIYDVIIDLRPGSPTRNQWLGVELSEDNRSMLYVPKGFAQGFQTLEDDTEVLYSVSSMYHPESEGGVRYNDPAFKIKWPLNVAVISEKDKSWPNVKL